MWCVLFIRIQLQVHALSWIVLPAAETFRRCGWLLAGARELGVFLRPKAAGSARTESGAFSLKA